MFGCIWECGVIIPVPSASEEGDPSRSIERSYCSEFFMEETSTILLWKRWEIMNTNRMPLRAFFAFYTWWWSWCSVLFCSDVVNGPKATRRRHWHRDRERDAVMRLLFNYIDVCRCWSSWSSSPSESVLDNHMNCQKIKYLCPSHNIFFDFADSFLLIVLIFNRTSTRYSCFMLWWPKSARARISRRFKMTCPRKDTHSTRMGFKR